MPAFFLVLACACWGLSFPAVKALHLEQSARLPEAGSAFLASWLQTARFGLAALILSPVVCRGGQPSRRELDQGLRLAWWGGAGMALQADGLAHTEASTSAFLTQAYCVILPLIACLRHRRAPDLRTLSATLLVMAGCAVLSGVRWNHLRVGRGELETLLAAVMFTFQILTLEDRKHQGNRSLQVTWVMCLGIAAMFTPLTALLSPGAGTIVEAGASWHVFWLVAALAVFCTVGAFMLMNHWQPRISATEAGLIYTTEPVFAAAYAMILPGYFSVWTGMAYANETFSTTLLTGSGLILAANVMVQLKRRPHSPAIAPAP